MKRPIRDGSLIFIFVLALVITSAIVSSKPVQAQERHPSRPNNGQVKRTTIDFEDQLVEGEVKKPELFYLLQKKQFNFGKLIRLRENFVPEMTRNAEDVGKSP